MPAWPPAASLKSPRIPRWRSVDGPCLSQGELNARSFCDFRIAVMGTGLPLLSYCGRIIGAKSRGDFAGTDACADRCTQTARRARFPGRFVSTPCERGWRAEWEL